MSLTYGDLFDFLEKKTNFHKDEKGNTRWDCTATAERPHLHEFFSSNSIDPETQERILKVINETGGYCDCEILMNTAFGFPRDIPLSEPSADVLAKRLEGAKAANKERTRLRRNKLQQERRRKRVEQK